jgi:hypothetical protein
MKCISFWILFGGWRKMKATEVLNSKWETMPEISKAVGMKPVELWPIVKQFIVDGFGEMATLQHSGCSVPVIRLKPGLHPTWRKTRTKR